MPHYKTWFENPKELVKRRKALGWTALQLSRKSGISRSVVANVESGRTALKGELASKLWTTIAVADVERRNEHSQFQGYSNAIAPFDKLKALQKLLNSKPATPATPATRDDISELSGEVVALRQHLSASTAIIREQALLLIDDKKQIESLRAEVSALRDQLARDIKRLESELGQKLKLAAQQGGEILSENEVTAIVSTKG